MSNWQAFQGGRSIKSAPYNILAMHLIYSKTDPESHGGVAVPTISPSLQDVVAAHHSVARLPEVTVVSWAE